MQMKFVLTDSIKGYSLFERVANYPMMITRDTFRTNQRSLNDAIMIAKLCKTCTYFFTKT